jgi:signal transduction histidine kinase
MWRLLFGKYKGIVAAIAVFLVLDAGVLLLNFYTSYQISDDAHAIHLANRQSMLTQRLFHSVEQLRDDLVANRSIEASQKKLATSYKQFDEVFDAFIYGGRLIGQGQGQDSLLLSNDYQALSDEYLTEAEKIWQPYRHLVSGLVYADYSETIDRHKLLKKAESSIAFSREKGDKLLSAVSDFAAAVENKTHQKTVDLRIFQSIAIALAVINFFVILLHFVKRLRSSDDKAQRAQNEMSEIMNTVRDGLFLLNQKYEIGSQYSASMKYLFRQETFADIGIFDLLMPLISKDDLVVAKDYVDSLFNPRVKSSLMDELNPLREVKLNITNKYGDSDHFFEFTFSRIFDNNEIIHLLVSVKDITESVGLRHKLSISNSRINQEASSVLSLMTVDFQLLTGFMGLLDQGIDSINNELEKPTYYFPAFIEKLDKINRIVHSLKGEASMLGLEMIEENLHSLEDKLVALNDKDILEGDDFLTVTVALTALVKSSESIRLFMSRFPAMAKNYGAGELLSAGNMRFKAKALSPLQRAFTDLSKKISRDNDKKINLDFSLFDESLISDKCFNVIKNIIIQLLRNAIIHGLESPKKRISIGKKAEGTVALVVKKVAGNIVVIVKDDGRGIDFLSIKNHLLSTSIYTKDQLDVMTPRELVKVIFKPGYSTAKYVDNHAGRGVGLDVVKAYVDSIGASLSVGCKAKRSSEFRILIPNKNDNQLDVPTLKSQYA